MSNYPLPWNCPNSVFFPKMEAELLQSSPPPRKPLQASLRDTPPAPPRTPEPYWGQHHGFKTSQGFQRGRQAESSGILFQLVIKGRGGSTGTPQPTKQPKKGLGGESGVSLPRTAGGAGGSRSRDPPGSPRGSFHPRRPLRRSPPASLTPNPGGRRAGEPPLPKPDGAPWQDCSLTPSLPPPPHL